MGVKKSFLPGSAVLAVALIAFFPLPAASQSAGGGSFIDSRDGQEYHTVKIGNQTWMAENLNYKPRADSSWCYDDRESNCKKYGRLYTWNAAKSVCPNGWHLPLPTDWDSLMAAAGGVWKIIGPTWFRYEAAGKKLKSASGWNNTGYDEEGAALSVDNGNGTDEFGFSALPGGLRSFGGIFHGAGEYGLWWNTMDDDVGGAFRLSMSYDEDGVDDDNGYTVLGHSVRCLKNNER
ncbi:MAG: fibrobacter succinogenes major paralogous domain-containing protein [Chitinispirillales bacterium]|jgi:uncharacterized protein (TIGR02145 family)|nr:fibrobacter succinogenes major paralogous domain-containing protein [Chitinispirillales bacterium]